MIVISRKKGESILIDRSIEVTVVEIRGDKVRLGITAPVEVPVKSAPSSEALRPTIAPSSQLAVAGVESRGVAQNPGGAGAVTTPSTARSSPPAPRATEQRGAPSHTPELFGTDTLGDDLTTIAALRGLVQRFVEERAWQPFHTPKNLAMSLAIEAAELMEHFQWLTADESRAAACDPPRRAAIADELADVLCYALALANVLDVDLARAVSRKIEKNAAKYPADQFRGRYGADDPKPPLAR